MKGVPVSTRPRSWARDTVLIVEASRMFSAASCADTHESPLRYVELSEEGTLLEI